MTSLEKSAMLRTLCGLTAEQLSDDSLLVYLELAKGIILRRLYPFVTDGTPAFPSKYDLLQVQIANELVAKIGSEGETSHNENGVNRSYGDAFVSKGLLKQIAPYGAVFGSSAYTEITETFEGDGETTVYTLLHEPVTISVSVGGTDVAYELSEATITFETAPAIGVQIVVRYSYENAS